MKQLSAFEYGVIAFKKGLKCVPAWDREFLEAHIKDLRVGEGIEAYNEWIRGWTQINLEEPVEVESLPK